MRILLGSPLSIAAVRCAGCVGLAVIFLSGCETSSPSASEAIAVSTRQSLLDSKTAVLCVKNKTFSPLNILFAFKNLDNQQETSYQTTVADRGSVEVGILECGWALAPNETVVITIPGYTNVKYKTHRTSEGVIGISEALW